MRVTYGKQGTRVTVDDGGAFDKMIKMLAPETVKAMEDEVDKIFKNAQDKWPVKTGDSKAALEAVYTVDSSGNLAVRASIINDAAHNGVYYAKYIKSNDLPNSGSAYVELLRKPLMEKSREIGRILAAELAKAVNRG